MFYSPEAEIAQDAHILFKMNCNGNKKKRAVFLNNSNK